jgi:hypothetical protein
MRIIICGSRDWTETKPIHAEINRLLARYGSELVIIHGVCETGADEIANDYCIQKDIRIIPFPAKWKRQGNAAGPIRNQRMIDEGKLDGVVAFDMGGTGTASMMEKARAAGLPVIVHRRYVDENLI